MASARPLPISTAAAIDNLELAARLVVEGARSGQHRSPFHGFTAEFSQHRPYRPGDDLKHLDWKLLARTNRLYSRQFRETTNLSALLVVDTSGSMGFPPSSDASPLTKFRYSIIIAAAMAHVIIEQGDAIGLLANSGERFVYVPAKGGRLHRQLIFTTLARLEPGGTCPLDRLIARAAELLKRRGVLIALSDFYDASESTLAELRRAAKRGHDLTLLQVLSRDEMTFPYSGSIEFDDLETTERRVIDADAIAPGYRQAVSGFLDQYRRNVSRDGHEHVLMPTDVPVEHALRSYLLRRAARAAASIGLTPGHE